MKWIKILKATLDLLFYFALLSAIGVTFFFFVAISNSDFQFQVASYTISNLHWSFYLVVISVIISQYLFLAMLYQMRRAARLLHKLNFLKAELSNSLNLSGIFCVIGVLLNRIPPFLFQIVLKPAPTNSSNYGSMLTLLYSFDSMLIVVCFGLFLIITAKIVQYSMVIKQENDLTI